MEFSWFLKLIMTKANMFTPRLEKDFKENLKIGVNGGIGSYMNQSGNVIGADVEKTFTINPKWNLEIISEYKEGNNFSEFGTSFHKTRVERL